MSNTVLNTISLLRKASQLYKTMMGHLEVIKFLILELMYQSLVFIVNIPFLCRLWYMVCLRLMLEIWTEAQVKMIVGRVSCLVVIEIITKLNS